MYASLRRLALLVCLSPAVARAQHDGHGSGAHAAPRLGTVSFPNSGARSAQAPFLRGLALLHSFEYDDAAAAFREAERADPSFAVAYWLEALTYSHILWREDDPEGGRKALARLGPTPATRLAKARTPRERAYGAAVEAFHADTTQAARVVAFGDSTRVLAERYPDDLEAAAFASVGAMMAWMSGGLPPSLRREQMERAARFAERVFAASPNHPGGAHYVIHVADMDAAYAPRALAAARAYDTIAPDAEHALHMPSHVYLPLGMWAELSASNERAWAASRASVRDHKLTGADLGFHSLTWLQYGYLEQGRWRAARALIDTARAVLAGADLDGATHVDARYALGQLQFLYAAETGRWTDVRIESPTAAPAGPSTASGRELGFLASSRYARAAAAAMRRDTTTTINVARLTGGTPDSSTWATRSPLSLVSALSLDAFAALARGDSAAASARLRDAARFEDRVPVIGPPSYLSPRELLGAELLAAKRPAEAAAEYERALAHQPNRSAALLGLARARAAAGDAAGAREAYRKLLANWAHADADLPALEEVRRGAR